MINSYCVGEITQTDEGSRKLSKSGVILSKTRGAASTPLPASLPCTSGSPSPVMFFDPHPSV